MPAILAALVLCAPQTAASVMDSVRVATGWDKPLTQDLVATGNGVRLGLASEFNMRCGVNGEFVYQFKSALGSQTGFDGKTIWDADRTGATRVLALGSAEQEHAAAMVISGSWLLKNVAIDAKLKDGNTLSVRRRGSLVEEQIKIDPKTHLPSFASFPTEAGAVEITLKDWRPAAGRMLPFAITLKEGGQVNSVKLSSATLAPHDASAFRMPAWKAQDTPFDATQPAKIETKRLKSGHIAVHPTVNGKDIGWFILDSGAGAMCIDKTAADGLKLDSIGEVPAVGVGGVVKSPFRSADTLTLGPVTMKDLKFVQLDLAPIGTMLGIKLSGIIGYDLFRRVVVELDASAPQVALYDPASYALSKGAWQPIRFDGGNIGIEASFEGNRKGWFRLDTGASGTVSFHSPFVTSFNLLKDRKVTKSLEGGVGGMVESYRGTIDYFEFAGHRFDKPEVGFSTSKVGVMANQWLVGNIGQDFMNPFLMVFDYPQSRMAFVTKG